MQIDEIVCCWFRMLQSVFNYLQPTIKDDNTYIITIKYKGVANTQQQTFVCDEISSFHPQ